MTKKKEIRHRGYLCGRHRSINKMTPVTIKIDCTKYVCVTSCLPEFLHFIKILHNEKNQ